MEKVTNRVNDGNIILAVLTKTSGNAETKVCRRKSQQSSSQRILSVSRTEAGRHSQVEE